MGHSADAAPPPPITVAVAVNGEPGGRGGRASRRAVRWALSNLLPKADRFVLVHVVPTLTSIPTPSGASMPIKQLDSDVVSMYVEDRKRRLEGVFLPFKKLCNSKKIQTLLLEGDDPVTSLVSYISNSRITSLVLGSCSFGCIPRKQKVSEIPSTVLKLAPGACKVYVVSRNGLTSNSVNSLSTSDSGSKCWSFTLRKHDSDIKNESPSGLHSSAVNSSVQMYSGISSVTDRSSEKFVHGSMEINHQILADFISDTHSVERSTSRSSTYSLQSDVHTEVEKLRLELINFATLYDRACEDLVRTQNKVHMLSSDYIEESKRVNAAIKREENFRKIAAEEREKHAEAVKDIEMARNLFAKEAYGRQTAELKGVQESREKQRIVDALFSSDKRYKRYSRTEIEVATDFFSQSKVIGAGSYGKVYKCNLDHTPVAIKVLRSDSSNGKEEFLREVEVLSKLRHPHIVLLLGACPEIGCLVYEYLDNGNLDDHINGRSSYQSLSWIIRFRLVFEVACGLSFLHNSKPEPIIHRDLKPGNILLDRNYVGKIGDIGLAKLITEIVPDNITEYRNSVLAGTLFYMDPEYQRTGTVRPKSDLYGFGIIILQILTARHPNGLSLTVENALKSGTLLDILDNSISDWPLAQSTELAEMALKCSNLRCRDRPDLDTEILPFLKKLADFADASKKVFENNVASTHYYCPILQEIMDDPHIAADGFTYEYKAIKLWVERHNVSPVTKVRLQHKILTPNHALYSAIQEWRRSQVTSKS